MPGPPTHSTVRLVEQTIPGGVVSRMVIVKVWVVTALAGCPSLTVTTTVPVP